MSDEPPEEAPAVKDRWWVETGDKRRERSSVKEKETQHGRDQKLQAWHILLGGPQHH